MTFNDDKAELRYLCLLLAKEFTTDPSGAILAAEKFFSFIEGTLDTKKN